MKGAKSFKSNIVTGNKFATDIDNQQIKDEPMFFNCSLDFAYENGGPITRSFIDALSPHCLSDRMVFDSRVHMLMPGWYPAIPGFHHDDVPRPDIPAGQHFITAGQPDYDNPRYHSKHILGLVNGDICPTEFAIGDCTLSEIPDGELIYRKWHEEVCQLLENGDMCRVKAPDRTLVYFNWQSFHQGTKAIGSGWRWFGRLSTDTDRADKITNEIRKQVQVYMEFPMEGW